MEELFKDKNYCMNEIRNARNIFTSKHLFNLDNCKRIMETLGFMYLYCPEEIMDTVLSTIQELELRMKYI